MNTSEQMLNEIQTTAAMAGLFPIIVTLLSIILVWFIMQEIKWEIFFKFPRSAKSRMFQVVISVVIGHSFASFIIDYWNWSTMLKYFVE
ncbi:MAG: DUF1146 family protein [Candidatus Pristimantibacillus sp.]